MITPPTPPPVPAAFRDLAQSIARDPQAFAASVPGTSLLHQPFEPYPNIQDAFLVSAYLSSAESVNPMEIVGTAHPDYIGLSSLQMLSAGKRMASLNLPLLAENPGYYLETTKKEPVMNYARVDGRLYISGEGNHRTAIVRCLFSTLGITTFHGIEYTDYQLDRQSPLLLADAAGIISRRRLPLSITRETRVVRRDDSPGWKRDHYETTITIRNFQRATEQRFSTLLLPSFVRALDATRFWHRWVGKNPYPEILP